MICDCIGKVEIGGRSILRALLTRVSRTSASRRGVRPTLVTGLRPSRVFRFVFSS